MTIVKLTAGVVQAWELPRDTRVFGAWNDGSKSAIVHRIDGVCCSVTTDKGTRGTIRAYRRVRRHRDGTWHLIPELFKR